MWVNDVRLRGRPSRRGVDWNHRRRSSFRCRQRRPSRRGVDWNSQSAVGSYLYKSRPSRRGVDWNAIKNASGHRRASRPSRRGVDWNHCVRSDQWASIVAPHAGAWIGTRGHPAPGSFPARVAPHAGAWIGTATIASRRCRTPVAPHAGAWIGTHSGRRTRRAQRRRPSRRGVDWNHRRLRHLLSRMRSPLTQGRGLERRAARGASFPCRVAPHAGAWIGTGA